MERDQYQTVQQAEMDHVEENDPQRELNPSTAKTLTSQQEDITPRTKNERTDVAPFIIYGLALLIVFFASLGFWIQGRRKPMYFSRKDTKWMFANPKTTTILWTAVASIIAWFTLWLYSCAVSLMARKLIIQGAKISTIESWVKLSSHGTMFDKRRPFLSLYTGLSAIVTAALTVGFAGLLTPISLVKSNSLTATELDITRSDFFDWYGDSTNRTVVGCTWWPYTNNKTLEHYTFSTCPFNDDTSLVLQAGRAAVEQGLGLKAVTKIGDVNFNGTTGGTLPVGKNGFRAFDNLDYILDEPGFPPVYNYSTLLQGSTVDVSCEENSTSPISEEMIGVIPTVKISGGSGPGNYRNYTHVKYNFNNTLSYGRCQYDYNFEFVVPAGGNLMSVQCPSMPSNGPGYYIFFRPFGSYVTDEYLKLPNLTCKVEPRVTINNVTYSSITNDFTSRVVETFDTPGMSPTDAEAIDAIFQIFWFGVSIEGNMVADSILSLRHQNGDDNRQTMAQSFENIIRGFYEMEMTSLRLYYSASHAPGSRNITGSLTHYRMGYNGAKEALYALVPLAIVVCMALTYLWWGLRVGGELFEFNPTRTTSLLVASSQGGLDLGEKIRPTSVKYPDEDSVQDVKIKFGELPHGVLGLTLDDEYTVQSPGLGGPRSSRIQAMSSV